MTFICEDFKTGKCKLAHCGHAQKHNYCEQRKGRPCTVWTNTRKGYYIKVVRCIKAEEEKANV
jgi:hypothetical protein